MTRTWPPSWPGAASRSGGSTPLGGPGATRPVPPHRQPALRLEGTGPSLWLAPGGRRGHAAGVQGVSPGGLEPPQVVLRAPSCPHGHRAAGDRPHLPAPRASPTLSLGKRGGATLLSAGGRAQEPSPALASRLSAPNIRPWGELWAPCGGRRDCRAHTGPSPPVGSEKSPGGRASEAEAHLSAGVTAKGLRTPAAASPTDRGHEDRWAPARPLLQQRPHWFPK